MQITGNFDTRLEQLRAVEAKIKSVEDMVDAKLKPYKDAREKLRALLLEMLNQSGQDSAKTSQGTVYKSKKRSASLEDPTEFKRHVIGTESWDLLDWKANITAVTDYAEANQGQLPPGVKLSTMTTIGVRAPAKSRKRKGATEAATPESNETVEDQLDDQEQDQPEEAMEAA